jgi:hypothetical protein
MGPTIAFDYVEVSGLPKLAWCAQFDRAASKLVVVHGAAVETRKDGFFEGAWAGDFGGDAYDATFMTGTGAKRSIEGVLFVTPNHTLDRILVLRKAGALFVSNSLAFLLVQSNERLDYDILFYTNYVTSVRFGLQQYQRSILTRRKLPVYFYYACNLHLGADGALRTAAKQPSPAFTSFAHYRAYLDDTVARIAQNATDARRKVQYAPIATVSRGYDSAAAMVVAMQVGCREALTFRESRGTVCDEDCGSVIAQQLGVEVREFGRLDYRKYANFPEIENSGGPNEFLSFGEALSGRLVFTGFHGDKLWDKNCSKVTKDLVRGDSSGSSITEYRLRVGFCHLPIPFVAADSHPSIHAISNSAEMRPWSLGNLYDRPIARRIVEEAGIPRHLFGQKKHAAGVLVSVEGLAATMSEQSLDDFHQYLADKWNVVKACKVNLVKLIELMAYLNRRATRVVEKAAHAAGWRFIKVPDLIPHRLHLISRGYLGKETMLFHWGVDRLMARYDTAVRKRELLNV